MTRINANIPPCKLIDQHLVAEYREIVRIPNAVKKIIDIKAKLDKCPKDFTLGTGHVLYFYSKIQFLHKRFLSIKTEMDKRGIANNMDDAPFLGVPEILYNDIEPSDLNVANQLVIDRITERIETMKGHPKYNKDVLTRQKAIDLLKF